MIKKDKKKLIKNNTLYTGYGDKGTTTLYHCNQQRISKSADIIEALGSLDEINAYLGVVKVCSDIEQLKLLFCKKNISYSSLLEEIQQTLFVVQAEIAGGEMSVNKKDLNRVESIIETISKLLPPIRSFTVSGGTLLSAELDFSRTLARKAERRIIKVQEGGIRAVSPITISYMNRLSSILFAMSRYANFLLSVKEEHPNYNN